eukprot:s5524_g7.t3
MLPTGPPSSHALHSAGQGRPSEPNGWSREHASHAPRRVANSAANSTAPRGPGGWTAQQSEEILEEENVRLSDDLRHRSLELQRLGREAEGLREQIREEQQRRQSRVADLTEQVITAQGQNKLLQAQLSQLQLRSSSSAADATGLKREVVAKTMELEKLVREFQQVHADLFSRAQSLSDSMLRLSDSNAPKSNASKQTDVGSPPRNLRSADSAPQRVEQSQFASLGPLDEETRHALKTRLQSLGDVVVFASDKFDACCASGHSIPPGAMRVRPRRCDHVFLIECLMPYWVEGLCPVCRCSFAYSRVDGIDESQSEGRDQEAFKEMKGRSVVLNTEWQTALGESRQERFDTLPLGFSTLKELVRLS